MLVRGVFVFGDGFGRREFVVFGAVVARGRFMFAARQSTGVHIMPTLPSRNRELINNDSNA